jgi:hypothetical protein
MLYVDPFGLKGIIKKFIDPIKKLWGPGWLCVHKNCDDPNWKCKKEKVLSKPEKGEGLEDVPEPGHCSESDGLYTGHGILKIPNNCTCTIDCAANDVKCTCTLLGPKPKVSPPDQPPTDWPPNPFVP